MQAMNDLTWTNEKRRLGDLVPWPRNPRQINKAEGKRLAESLDEFGQVDIIAIGPEDEVYNGHQRINVWIAEHGPDFEADVRVASRALTEKEREKLTVLLHRGAVGEWDFGALASWGNEAELVEWGFEPEELSFVQPDRPADPGPQIDRAAELQEKWSTAIGQLWRLGEHLLYVGDAASGKIECHFAIYDPPFDWTSRQQETGLSWVSWENAVVMGRSPCFPLIERNDFLHWWIWDKRTSFGGPGYHPVQSCAIVLAFGELHRFYHKQGLAILRQIDLAVDWEAVPQYVPITRGYRDEDEIAGNPHIKPDVLCDYIIALYSQCGELVGDPFAGSGSFLISCVRMGRKYHGAEIDPAKCAVILERFQDATNIAPSLA
jgi:hypothetical protein